MRIRYYMLMIVILCVVYILRLWQAVVTTNHTYSVQSLEGTIREEPAQKYFGCQLTVEDVTVQTRTYNGYGLGDRVLVSGSYQKKVTSTFPTVYVLIAKEIKIQHHYQDYSLSEKVLKYPYIWLQHAAKPVREDILDRINRLFLQPEAGLLAGMLIGVKDALSSEMTNAVRISGLAHLVVASGGNIAIVMAVTLTMLNLCFSRRLSFGLTTVAVVCYLFLAGFEPPLVRAGLMSGLAIAGQMSGKKTSGVWILLLTAGVMLIFDPLLIFQLSFQLSMAATAGIVLFSEPLQNFFRIIVAKRYISNLKDAVISILSQSLAAQVMVIPLLLVSFGSINVLSILANLLVAPLVTPIMIFGLGVVTLSYVWWQPAVILSWCLTVLLECMVLVSRMFSKDVVIMLKTELSWWAVGVSWSFCLLGLMFVNRRLYLAGRNNHSASVESR